MDTWPECKVCGSSHEPWRAHHATYTIDAGSPEEAARKARAVLDKLGLSGNITVDANEAYERRIISMPPSSDMGGK